MRSHSLFVSINPRFILQIQGYVCAPTITVDGKKKNLHETSNPYDSDDIFCQYVLYILIVMSILIDSSLEDMTPAEEAEDRPLTDVFM